MKTLPKNVELVISIELSWNNEENKILERECYVGVYDKNTPNIDAFFWFEDPGKILGNHGDFTVHNFTVLDGRNNLLLKNLEAYDVYMMDQVKKEGYSMPISIQDFLGYQVSPIALNNIGLYTKRDLLFFSRFKNLYLGHSSRVINSIKMANTPVCYSEWLKNKGVV